MSQHAPDPRRWIRFDRVARHAARLSGPRYDIHAVDQEGNGVFRGPDYDWPGDLEGRALLAFTLQGRLGNAECRTRRDDLFASFPAHLGEHGHFGPPVAPDAVDEQQIAGHGWVLRGLCEYFADTADDRAIDQITTVVHALVAPALSALTRYTTDRGPTPPSEEGSVVGQRSTIAGGWTLSTDTGAVLILLDGLVQSRELVADEIIDAAVRALVDILLNLDLETTRPQTHAVLSGCRGLLRLSEHTGDADLCRAAIEIFRSYRDHATSETHSNWNWFGRPSHSEPCAIVDSMLLCHQLWRLTGERDYLDEWNRITENAFLPSQRQHGGFGCDSIVGWSDSRPTDLIALMDDAWFCCTLRAAEGFWNISTASAVSPREVTFLTCRDMEVETDLYRVELRARLPRSPRVEVRLTGDCSGLESVRVFLGRGIRLAPMGRDRTTTASFDERTGFVTLRGLPAAGGEVSFDTSIAEACLPSRVDGYVTHSRGPWLIGERVSEGEPVREPLGERSFRPDQRPVRVLFDTPPAH